MGGKLDRQKPDWAIASAQLISSNKELAMKISCCQVAAVAWCSMSTVAAQQLERLNVSSQQAESNLECDESRVSGDGRFVVFTSVASNLVQPDSNNVRDVFCRDRKLNVTEIISLDSNEMQATGASWEPSLSGDGRFVVFSSIAPNLAPDANPGASDVFVRDRLLGTTSLVSVATSGAQGGQDSRQPCMSGDARFVAFVTRGALVANDTNGKDDVYLRDRLLGTTTRESVSSGGAQADDDCLRPSLSADGGTLAFESRATTLFAPPGNNFVHVYVRQLSTSTTYSPTADPNWIIGTGDSGYTSLTADGRLLCFQSLAPNLVSGDGDNYIDAFLYDTQVGQPVYLGVLTASQQKPTDDCFAPRISGDGRFIVVSCDSPIDGSGISNGMQNAYRRDLVSSAVKRMSPGMAFALPNGPSWAEDISYDGDVATFRTQATNIVPHDTTSQTDIIAYWDKPCFGNPTYCTAKVNSQGCVPTICAWGFMSGSGPDDFYVRANEELNGKTGIMIWSRSAAAIPFGGGTLCVQPPIKRTTPQASGGSTSGTDCTGTYSFHFSQSYASSQAVVVGDTVYCQYWSRDPFVAPPGNIALTNAIHFTVLP